MGRPKKVTVEEIAPESPVKKPALKTVEAVHTIKYSEPVTVPVAEPEPEDDQEAITDEVEFEEEAEPKSRPLSPRARLREKLAKLGVTNQALKLRIDRLPNYDINGQSGINAEKDYIRTTACTEAFFDSDDYLEHIRSIAGPGTYWLTLRGGKSIVAQWQERIGGAPQALPSAENPSVEVYAPAIAPVDPMASLLKQAKQFSELRKLLAPESEHTSRVAANSDAPTTEQALLTLMNADSGIVDTVASKLRGLLRGNNGSSESERSWVDVLYVAIERDTLPKLINQFTAQFRAPQDQATGNQLSDSPPPTPPDVLAQQRLLAVLTNALRFNSDVATVLPALDGFTKLFPEHREMIEQFMDAETNNLLAALPGFFPPAAEVVQLPHAAEWIGKLKALYFSEGEESEQLQ